MDVPINASSLLTPQIQEGEEQFSAMKQRLIQQGVRGGALQEGLADIERQRGIFRDSLRSDLFDKLLGVSFGAPTVTLNALGQSSRTFAGIGANQDTIQASNQQALGAGAGQIVGLATLGALGAFG